MPNREERGQSVGSDGKTWAEWKRELSTAVEELDKACASARQVIYRLRPLLRPKPAARAESDADDDELARKRDERRGREPD